MQKQPYNRPRIVWGTLSGVAVAAATGAAAVTAVTTAPLAATAAAAQVPFRILRPENGATVRETVRVQIPRSALGEARYRQVETYSTGMKQRIKLAQALVHGPKLLFLDEPTNGLDPQGRDEMLDLIRDISHGKGLSVIVSSHLLPDIERTCDAVVVMKGGQVMTQGPIAELRGTGQVQYEVDLRAYSQPFVDTLQRRSVTLAHSQGSRCRFTFPPEVGASSVGQILFTAARESGAQVRGFRPAQRSLEEIFMEAVTV